MTVMAENSAKDDAAGLQIASRMTSQINGLTQGNRNANDGISMCQVAEGATEEITSMLQRMRTLAIQSANGTNADSERDAIQQEVNQLSLEIQRIGEQTTFGGTLHVLNGSIGTLDKDGNLTDTFTKFQVGSHSDQTVTATFSDLTFAGLLNYTQQTGVKDTASGQSIAFATAAARPAAGATSQNVVLKKIDDQDHDGLTGWNKDDKKVGNAGAGNTKKEIKTSDGKTDGKLFSISMTSHANAEAAIKCLDVMINHVDSERAQWGAVENRLSSTINNQSHPAGSLLRPDPGEQLDPDCALAPPGRVIAGKRILTPELFARPLLPRRVLFGETLLIYGGVLFDRIRKAVLRRKCRTLVFPAAWRTAPQAGGVAAYSCVRKMPLALLFFLSFSLAEDSFPYVIDQLLNLLCFPGLRPVPLER